MKQKIEPIFILLIVAITLQSCVSPLCGCSPPPSPHELLVGKWFMKTVRLEEQDVSSDWQNFSIEIDYDKYTTEFSINSEIWPESGTYVFKYADGSGVNFIERSDSLLINLDYINDNELHLSFMESKTGAWEFIFQRVQ